MPIRRIPDDVRRFIQASIDSMAQLEALLIVREHPDIAWTVAAMSARLYIAPEQTSAILFRLCADRLVVIKGNDDAQFQYQPGSDELRLVTAHRTGCRQFIIQHSYSALAALTPSVSWA